MKISDIRKRLRPNRPMTSITLRMPDDVVDDLKRVAPRLGFSGYQPLIRAYVGQGLRRDLERLDRPPDVSRIVTSLRRHGVAENVIKSAVDDIQTGLTKALRRERGHRALRSDRPKHISGGRGR